MRISIRAVSHFTSAVRPGEGERPRFVPLRRAVRLRTSSTRVGAPQSRQTSAPGRRVVARKVVLVGSVVKKRRKRMAKKKHRKLLKKTRIQRRRQGK